MKKLLSLLVIGSTLVCSAELSQSDKDLFKSNGLNSITNKITKDTAMDWLDYGISINNIGLITYSTKLDIMSNEDLLKAYIKLGDLDYNNVRLISKYIIGDSEFNRINESVLLPIWKKWHSEGKYSLASAAFIGICYSSKLGFSNVSTERLNWCNSIVKDLIAKLDIKTYSSYIYSQLLIHLARLDSANGTSEAVEFVNKEFSSKYFIKFSRLYRALNEKSLGYYIISGSELVKVYEAAEFLDSYSKDKSNMIKAFPRLSKDLKLGVDAAIYLEDIDKLIDILLLAKEELTADQMNNFIPMINAVDSDYRKADIIKVLKNINSRYTLRLYDDQKTWEPILAKIRAMIDVRM